MVQVGIVGCGAISTRRHIPELAANPKAKLVASGEALVVPLPTAGGGPLADADLIAWVGQLLDQLWPVKPATPAEPTA